MPYRNSEKRKEKSRDAARHRRGKESEVFSSLCCQLPVATSVLNNLDKASMMRIAISHLKIRKLLGSVSNGQGKSRTALDQQYMKALDGFIIVIAKEGDFVFLSENVNKHLGLSQIDLIGQSIYEFAHPCDHEEIRDVLEKTPKSNTELDFFVRLKCTLTSKGKSINLKSATYKVMHCTGHYVTVSSDRQDDDSSLMCLVLIAQPIAHPSNIEILLDTKTFLSTHSMNMKFTFCDDRVKELIGHEVSELQDMSLYSFIHGAHNQQILTAFTHLFNKGQTSTGLYRFLAKGGGYVFMETHATIIYNQRTEKPQHVVCVHYAVSDIMERNLVLSDLQLNTQKTPVLPIDMCASTPAIKAPSVEDGDDIILATESIFAPRTAEMMELEMMDTNSQTVLEDIAYRAPAASEVLISLDLQELENVSIENQNLVADVADEPYNMCTSTPDKPILFDKRDKIDCTEDQTVVVDPEDIDIKQRAPYIPMNGDDDLMFGASMPALEEYECGASIMLGTTESIFNSLPEEMADDDEQSSHSVPIAILRKQVSEAKEQQHASQHRSTYTTTINQPNETNRLETGPPNDKRRRLEPPTIAKDIEQQVGEEAGGMKGSSVLLNLLLRGEDRVNGYSIPFKEPLHNILLESSSDDDFDEDDKDDDNGGSTSLRDLLTCPMSNMSKQTLTNGQKLIQGIRFNNGY